MQHNIDIFILEFKTKNYVSLSEILFRILYRKQVIIYKPFSRYIPIKIEILEMTVLTQTQPYEYFTFK